MKQFNNELVLLEKTIPGGWNFSYILKKGTSLRLTDIEGGINVSTLLFNQKNYGERYNMADTLKAQFTSYLTKGHALYSDMGRILVSIINDTCGWHDTVVLRKAIKKNTEKRIIKSIETLIIGIVLHPYLLKFLNMECH